MDFVTSAVGQMDFASMFGQEHSGMMDSVMSYADAAMTTTTAYLEMTYTTGAHTGLMIVEGGQEMFVEYGYLLSAIAISILLIAFLWFQFQLSVVNMFNDMGLPNIKMPISYSVAELAAKLSMTSVSTPAVDVETAKPKMSMSKEVSPKAKTSMKKEAATPASAAKKSPMRKRSKTPTKKVTPSKKK